jgi:twitching motility protein PilT
MRDGDTEGMQHFDGVIEQLIRNGIVDFEAGLQFSTNAGNMRLELADYLENPNANSKPKPRVKEERLTELEVEP